MGIEKKLVSVRMDEWIIDELRAIAESENRPLSNLIETIIKQYLASKKPTESTEK